MLAWARGITSPGVRASVATLRRLWMRQPSFLTATDGYPYDGSSMRRKLAIRFVAGVLLLAVPGCKKSAPDGTTHATPRSGAKSTPNVLLVTLDTTRADRLGCYGHRAARTPVLDGLARDGVRFERAYASAPITLPSHTTLLTGTYPPEHGVRGNREQALGPDLTVLAEIFQRKGYRTGAFLAAPVLGSRYGLARGFDTYDDDMGLLAPGRPRHRRHAIEVTQSALRWLGSAPDKSFLCWVHYFDPHAPYEFPPGEIPVVEDHYDAEIALVDRCVGDLAGWLDANGLRDDTLIVAVGDHGESLGEHGYDEHCLLVYDTTLRVPLIVSQRGRFDMGAVHTGVVQLVDVMPTILECMGWSVPEQVSGISLAPALTGGDLPIRSSYGESDYPFDAFGWSKLRCLTNEQWKYIRAPKIELYDLRADPGELVNLASKQPAIVRRMELALAQIEASMSTRDAADARVDSRTLSALQSLGYVQGGHAGGEGSLSLRNPVDMVQVDADFRQAAILLNEKRVVESRELLERAFERSPESFVVVELLAIANLQAGLVEEAQRYVMKGIELNPRSAKLYSLLALGYERRGRFDQCARSCATGLTLDPGNVELRGMRDRAAGKLSQQRAMIDDLVASMGQRSLDGQSYLSLAALLVNTGRAGEAVHVLREAQSRYPDDVAVLHALARTLAVSWDSSVRDGATAVELARRVIEMAGGQHHVYHSTLAAALAEAGEFAEAQAEATRAVELARAAGDDGHTMLYQRRVQQYQARQPYHELP